MARKVVTFEDLERRYGPSCEGFVPEIFVQVVDPRNHVVLREDYMVVRIEGTLEFGYVPGDSEPVYAKPPKGGWQCMLTHGLVKEWDVSFRQVRQKDEEGVVYFVQVGNEGPYKIGWSADVSRRMGELQVANPSHLHLRGTVPGTRETEAEFHQRFRAAHVSGEWFQNTEELRAFIQSLG